MTETDRPADHGADRPSLPASDPGENEPTGRWLPVGEAARTLGISRDAVWSRIKRRTLPYRRDPDDRALVLIGTTDRPNGPPARKAELTALRVENKGLHVRLADKDAEIARLTGIIERRDREAERMQVLLQMEQQQVKALTDQHQQAPWWRRWFQR